MGPGERPGQPSAPSEDAQASAEPLRGQAANKPESKPTPDSHQDEATMSEVVVGTLDAVQEDKWKCKVPSCAKDFHRLKDCKVFDGINLRIG